MTTNRPPEAVMHQFLRVLTEMIVNWEELLVPVVRGSVLMRHWFGEGARPAADIDLECFQPHRPELPEEEEQGWHPGEYGMYREFESLVDFGKAMGRYAARMSADDSIQFFDDEEHPEDGASLWTYGTPGERYYTGWRWAPNAPERKEGDPDSGLLQIDYAESGSYALSEIDTNTETMNVTESTTYEIETYSQEMMLAAKLSWLLRGFNYEMSEAGPANVQWTGQMKDLFDAHLLVTQGELDPQTVQRMLLVVGVEDKLDWNHLEAMFTVREGRLSLSDFHNWEEFVVQYPNQSRTDPVEMLREITEALEPMLGDLYRPDELGFLYSIHQDPADEFPYLVYADWLEERGDSRCEFLRLFTKTYFRKDELSAKEMAELRVNLKECYQKTSAAWLHRVFRTGDRFHAVQQGILAIEENLLF